MPVSKAKNQNILISGNEAVALGALRAGLKFYAAYPMTPASSILHFMAKSEHNYKIIVKHTEDEISAINMVIGASLAGSRSMCATSGGGFSLMVEGFGYGGIIETPFVCVVVSRPGPATGMPTWSGQGDLRFVMHAAQDEFPRIILAPGDAVEAFKLTFQAFNLADKYQVPVLILSDKLLAESYFTVKKDEFRIREKIDRGDIVSKHLKGKEGAEVFSRYKPTKTGISPRPIPGIPGNLYIANSDEHDEFGYSEEDAENRVSQMRKRMRKLEYMVKQKDAGIPNWYGPKNADITLICWGSTKGVCLEVLKFKPNKVNVLHFNYIYPLDIKRVCRELSKIKRSICLEGNYSGLFADYLFEKTGYKCDNKFVKYNGRPFFAEEVVGKLKI